MTQTILVIDDDEALRCTVLSALKTHKFAVLAARNGPEGIHIAATMHPDLILCDLNMGENSGYECIETLRSHPETAGIPVILMTGQAVENYVEGETLMKPFTLPGLISAVNRHLKGSMNPLALGRHTATPADVVAIQPLEHEIANSDRHAVYEKPSVEKLEELLAWVQFLREEERNSIARAVHDDLSQKLTVLALEISSLDLAMNSKGEFASAGARMSLRKMKDLVQSLITSAQEIMAQMRPKVLDEFGLVAALEWLVQDLRKKGILEGEIVLPTGEPALPKVLAAELFRLTQEILSNVTTNAPTVRIAVWQQEKWLHIEVSGRNVPAAPQNPSAYLNLLAIRERTERLYGNFELNRSVSDVTVKVSVPLQT